MSVVNCRIFGKMKTNLNQYNLPWTKRVIILAPSTSNNCHPIYILVAQYQKKITNWANSPCS